MTEFEEEIILSVQDLFPSTVLKCRSKKINGVITQHGSSLSHAAILAKSFGIPVALVNNNILNHFNNNNVILDSRNNTIIFNPEKNQIKSFKKFILNQKRIIKEENKSLSAVVTKDGVEIDIDVNIDHVDEIANIQNNVKGIGLFRTEFLFMSSETDFPSVKRQFAWYKKTVLEMAGRPVIFRVLDIGGDKLLPYFNMGRQENPFLGLRSHRVFQYHPEILETQVRALFMAAKLGPLKIMYPMVNTIEDLEYFKDIYEDVKKGFSVHPPIGIMVETPAAVFEIERLIKLVDFISIGTNDLVQYTLTVDRNNENAARFYQPFSPVVIRMLKQVADTCIKAEKPISICGEIASDLNWTALLIGLGFRNLSITPFSFGEIKGRINMLTINNCEQLAKKISNLEYLKEIKTLMTDTCNFDLNKF